MNTLLSTPPLALPSVKREIFPNKPRHDSTEFCGLFSNHGYEVRGRALELDWNRYHHLQKQGRLVWVVARNEDDRPVGYACGFWYQDLHYYRDKVASDDLWYVYPDYRRRGTGWQLKTLEHSELRRHGARVVYDVIRESYDHPNLMKRIGFTVQGHKWMKTL